MTRQSDVGVPRAGALRFVEGEQRELGVGPVLGGRRVSPIRPARRLPRRFGDFVSAERDGGSGDAAGPQQLAAIEAVLGAGRRIKPEPQMT